MNASWYAGSIRIVVAVFAGWRIWAELKTMWPTAAVGREILLRYLWRDAGWTVKGSQIAPRDETSDTRDPCH